MPSDAKFGLAVGVTLVIAVAVLFYHKEPTTAAPPTAPATTAPLPAVPPAPLASSAFSNGRSTVAQTLIHTRERENER
jgi:hypothetical protein